MLLLYHWALYNVGLLDTPMTGIKVIRVIRVNRVIRVIRVVG